MSAPISPGEIAAELLDDIDSRIVDLDNADLVDALTAIAAGIDARVITIKTITGIGQ